MKLRILRAAYPVVTDLLEPTAAEPLYKLHLPDTASHAFQVPKKA